MKKLWYKQPATQFVEALPLGNGRLGVMVYGGTEKEKISLNEDTLWSGYPKDKKLPNAKDGIKEAVFHMKNHEEKEAEKVLFEKCLGEYTDAYQPAGSVWIKADTENISEYVRELNLEDAITYTTFRNQGYLCVRKAFVSAVDDVFVMSVKNEREQAVTEIEVDIPHPYQVAQEGNYLVVKALAPYYSAPNYANVENPIRYDSFEYNRALTYAIVIGVDTEWNLKDQKMFVNSSNFHIYMNVETNFEAFDRMPLESKVNPIEKALEKLKKAMKKGYEAIEKDHVADYQCLFKRVNFELEGKYKDYLPMDERLKEYQKDKSDVGLPVMLFDFGRYLTIASSRKGTQATNLQGIWNEELRAPWSSNYTININTQMNYWHVEAANLSECHYPMIELVKHVSKKGSEVAEAHYGCRGWCSHHNTDIWGSATAITGDNPCAVQYGFWPVSAAWLCRHIWEHYEYTLDKEFLEENWEVMKGSAQFLIDWFEENEDGKLVAPISTSPENAYKLNGESHFLSNGVAMDQGIACDIFTACVKAAELLGKDEELSSVLKECLKKLKMYEVGSKGQILEWDKEREEADPTHRHISLLYGVYPGNSINISKTPEWFEAAKTTMDLRGDEATGWSFGWKACAWARLRDGDRAKFFLDNILRPVEGSAEINYGAGGGVYMNLFCAHPPFQIDGNFGITAAICEMFLQYDGDTPVLCPAVPSDWKHGKISGLCLKGGKMIDIEW